MDGARRVGQPSERLSATERGRIGRSWRFVSISSSVVRGLRSRQLAARAEAAGIVSRVEYVNPDEEAEALIPGPEGLPDVRLVRVRDRLPVVTPHGWVIPRVESPLGRASTPSRCEARGITKRM